MDCSATITEQPRENLLYASLWTVRATARSAGGAEATIAAAKPRSNKLNERLKCFCATNLFFQGRYLVSAISKASIHWKWLTVKLLQDLEQPSRRTNDVVVAMQLGFDILGR